MDGKRTEFENGIPSAKKLFFVCAFQICSSFFPSLTLLLKSFIQNFLHLAVNGYKKFLCLISRKKTQTH